MAETNEKITLTHGSGGRQMHKLIREQLVSKLKNGILEKMEDCALLENEKTGKLAMTTDSYVVSPLFFKGGDIGRLCICGTVNDLATSGAEAEYLSLAFILEEGFPLSDLKKIIDSISRTAVEAGVKIVTGDTNVVKKGKGDGIYINTCAIGFIPEGLHIASDMGESGDIITVTGSMGNHETALILARNLINFQTEIQSDVTALNQSVKQLLKLTDGIKTIKDPTRGGLASALCEIAENSSCEMIINEEDIPVDKDVQAVCNLTGLDPLYLANEGKYIIISRPDSLDSLVKIFPQSSVIGKITTKLADGRVLMKTTAGGIRRITMLETAQLPRIC